MRFNKFVLLLIFQLYYSLPGLSQPPVNDDCTGAILISPSPQYFCDYIFTQGTTSEATDSGLPETCGADGDDDVWYKFAATHETHYVFIGYASGTDPDIVISAYSGVCGSLDSLTCVNNNGIYSGEELTLSGLTIGDTVFVRIFDGSLGSSDLVFDLCIYSPPANDDCLGAFDIIPVSGESVCMDINTQASTNSGISAGLCGGIPDDDVWYSFTPIQNFHSITFSTGCEVYLPGEFILELMTGDCNNLTSIDCMNVPYDCQPYTLYGNYFVPGEIYYIRLFGSDTLTPSYGYLCIETPPMETEDECISAELLTVNGNTCNTASYSNNIAGSTSTSEPVTSCNAGPYFDLWYKFAATNTRHIVKIDVTAGGDIAIDGFTGNCSSLSFIDCVNNTSTGEDEMIVLENLVVGDTVFVRVYDANNIGESIIFDICVLTPPANDVCINATLISNTDATSCNTPISGDTRAATGMGGCGGGIADDDVWYKFVATADTHAIKLNISTIIDPMIELFDACNGNSLGCTSDNFYFLNNAIIGNTYYIRIFSSSNSGNGSFSICVSTPPSYAQCTLAVSLNPSSICPESPPIFNNTGTPNNVYFKFNANYTGYTIVIKSTATNFYPFVNIDQDCNPIDAVSLLYSSFQLEENEWRFTYGSFATGTEYNIAVHSSGQGDFTICILEPNEHDECVDALEITSNTEYNLTTHGCTQSNTSLFCASDQNDSWSKFVPAISQTYYVNILPSNPSQLIYGEILTGNDCTDLSLVTCISQSGYVSFEALSGNSYYIRIWIKQSEGFLGIKHKTGDFVIHISDAQPTNNNCANATTVSHVASCSYISGSTYGATNDNTLTSCNTNSNSADVWYKFTATSSNIRIKVKTLSEHFNPVIKLFQATNCSNLSFKICADNFDIGEDEVLQYNGVSGASYYILITENGYSNNAGNFEVCVTTNTDREFILAKYNQSQGNLPVGSFNNYIGEVKAYFVGSGSLNQITQIKGQVTPNHNFVSNVSVDFDPAPNGSISAFGNENITVDSSFNINGTANVSGPANVFFNKLIFYSDIKCDATISQNFGLKIDSIKIGTTSFPVKNIIGGYKNIIGFTDYYTVADGNWSYPLSWSCGNLPPNMPTSNVFVRNNIVLDDEHIIGNLTVLNEGHLIIPVNTELTLGLSSQGTNTMHTTKHLSMSGKLNITGGTLNVNGGISVGDSLIMSSGVINIDPNNGTSSSYNWHALSINTIKVKVTGGQINILDPSYNSTHNSINIAGFSDYPIVYINTTVKLGGGDDTNLANLKGFRIRSKTPYNNQMPATFGLMFIDSLSVEGGRYAQRRHFSADLCLYVGSLHIVNNAEIYIIDESTPLIITKNFVNNGYCMIHDLLSPYRSIYFTSTLHNSSFVSPGLSSPIERVFGGSGFFSNNNTYGYPLTQEGNTLRGLSLNNTIRLLSPLTVLNNFELHGGKLFTSEANLLTLGSDTPNVNITSCNYVGIEIAGIVGPVKKWYNGFLTSSQQRVIPFYDRECYINFSNTNLGYVMAEFKEQAPLCEGLPLVNEQSTTIRGVSPSGYWQLSGNNVSGSYSIAVNAFNFVRMDGTYILGDYNNIRLIKKNVSGIWGLSGSTTTNGPVNMFSVTSSGLNGISDFGIGIADPITRYKTIKNGSWHIQDTWNQCSVPSFETTLDVDVNHHISLTQNSTIFSDLLVKSNGILNINNNSILQVGNPTLLKSTNLESSGILNVSNGLFKVFGLFHQHPNSTTEIGTGSGFEVKQ